MPFFRGIKISSQFIASQEKKPHTSGTIANTMERARFMKTTHECVMFVLNRLKCALKLLSTSDVDVLYGISNSEPTQSFINNKVFYLSHYTQNGPANQVYAMKMCLVRSVPDQFIII